ncbi:hypothetical protein BV898_12000 [Hypsibius exemplaris]|uniref:C2H2-type domain-containing protein n=1 Tax=Hypsibius exemplaris TaxID=2072580 RepID=A0A1W0WF00_HYPEX|nr:hypothetical protein BV898_12000 [Hypsibius exemplaris]
MLAFRINITTNSETPPDSPRLLSRKGLLFGIDAWHLVYGIIDVDAGFLRTMDVSVADGVIPSAVAGPSCIQPPSYQAQRVKVMFEGLEIPSRYYLLDAAPFEQLKSRVREQFKANGYSRRYFLLLWIDIDGDEILLDSEEALRAAFECVPVDQSGYKILRILARHSAAAGLESQMKQNTSSKARRAEIPGSSQRNGHYAAGNLEGGESSSRTSIKSRHESMSPRRLRSASRGPVPEEPGSPELAATSFKKYQNGEESGVYECEKCDRKFPRKSSRTFHQNRCDGSGLSAKQKLKSTNSAKRSATLPNFQIDAADEEEDERHASSLENSRSRQREPIHSQSHPVEDSSNPSDGYPCSSCGRVFKAKGSRTNHAKTCGQRGENSNGNGVHHNNGDGGAAGGGYDSDGGAAGGGDYDSNGETAPKKARYSSEPHNTKSAVVCDPGCGRAFSSKHSLERHQGSCAARKAAMLDTNGDLD